MTPNPFRWSFRAQFLLASVACVALMGFALYAQFQMGLEPCPLCIFQRIAFAALGVVFLVGALHAPRGRPGGGVYGDAGLRVPRSVGAGIAGAPRLDCSTAAGPGAVLRPATGLPAAKRCRSAT